MTHQGQNPEQSERITSFNAEEALMAEWTAMGFEVKLPLLDRNGIVGSDPSGLDSEFNRQPIEEIKE